MISKYEIEHLHEAEYTQKEKDTFKDQQVLSTGPKTQKYNIFFF